MPKWDEEADVLYDRYGGVGAVTPIADHDSGDRVLAVEKLPGDVSTGMEMR